MLIQIARNSEFQVFTRPDALGVEGAGKVLNGRFALKI